MTIQTPKILVVDDEPDLELLIRQKFRKEIKEGRYNFEFSHEIYQRMKKPGGDIIETLRNEHLSLSRKI